MSETPDAVLLEPGEAIPDDLPAGTPVYVKLPGTDEPLAVGTELEGGGIVAPPLSDGCLGQHWPDAETCSEHPAS